jgi:hypothetical protein
LAQLKKLKIDKQVSDSSNSNIESAAFSLTQLHGNPFFKGPVHKFLASPILDSHGQMVDFMPPYGGGFDALGVASQYGCVHGKDHHSGSGFVSLSDTFPNKKAFPPYVPAAYGAFSLLQLPPIAWPTSMVGSDLSSTHMDIHQAPIPTTSVAVSPEVDMRR